MKKLLPIIVLAFLLVNCKKENRTDYVINGNAKDVYNGMRVYLKSIDKQGRQIVNDTAIVMNEKFQLTGSTPEPVVRFLSVDGTPGELIFMLENNEIDIDINKQNILESVVTGSETNNDFKAFEEEMGKIRDENKRIITEYRQVINSRDSILKDSIYKELQAYGEKLTNYPLVYINENRDTYFSLNLIDLESNKPKINVEAFLEAFENLDPSLKNSAKGVLVRKKLDSLNVEYQKIAHLEVGKIAPNFEAPTPDGDIVNLNELKGKVTIVDFWAAWCGPCRKENPNVVRIYNQYHDQGLEIIGVSLDGARNQKDPKQAWLDAIEKDKLAWHQVSHLQYFNDPVARLYNITSIPATYILDSEGKIAAKNLRGRALEVKVKELLNK